MSSRTPKPYTGSRKVQPKIDLDSRLLAAIQRRPGGVLADYHRALYLPPLRVGHLTAIRQAAERLVTKKLIRLEGDPPNGPTLHPVTPKKGA